MNAKEEEWTNEKETVHNLLKTLFSMGILHDCCKHDIVSYNAITRFITIKRPNDPHEHMWGPFRVV